MQGGYRPGLVSFLRLGLCSCMTIIAEVQSNIWGQISLAVKGSHKC